jgi:Domain of unknown function (DUF4390)
MLRATVSITPCLKSIAPDDRSPHTLLPVASSHAGLPMSKPAWATLVICWLTCFGMIGAALADNANVKQAALIAREDGFVLDAEFELEFPNALVDSVNRGVALYFVLEVEVARPRWYWLDDRPINFSRTYKLTYAPLTQQYRLTSSLFTQNFNRFDDVRRALSRVRALPIGDKSSLRRLEGYQGQIRFRLDTSQLPKPLQIGVVGSRDWVVNTEWQRLEITP